MTNTKPGIMIAGATLAAVAVIGEQFLPTHWRYFMWGFLVGVILVGGAIALNVVVLTKRQRPLTPRTTERLRDPPPVATGEPATRPKTLS